MTIEERLESLEKKVGEIEEILISLSKQTSTISSAMSDVAGHLNLLAPGFQDLAKQYESFAIQAQVWREELLSLKKQE